MRPLSVIEEKIPGDSLICLTTAGVVVKKDFLVFQGAPEALYQDVVEASASASHADGNAFFLKTICESLARELYSLIGIENFGNTHAKRPLQGLETKAGIQGVRQTPGQDIAAEQIHDGYQIEKSPLHADIRDIRGPNLVRADNLESVEQIRIDPVLFPFAAGMGSGTQGHEPHLPHKPLYALVINRFTLLLSEPLRHFGDAVKRRPGVLLVDESHEVFVVARVPTGLIVIAGSIQP